MPKRGASRSSIRRSRSPSWPVISACSGALKPSASAFAGISSTRPSVIMKTPPIRSEGTSASPVFNAENSRVPSSSAIDWPLSITRTSTSPSAFRLFSAPRWLSRSAPALADCLAAALIDDDRDDFLEACGPPAQERDQSRQEEQAKAKRAETGPAPARVKSQPDDAERQHAEADRTGQGRSGENERLSWLIQPRSIAGPSDNS